MVEINPYFVVTAVSSALTGRKKTGGQWESMNCLLCKIRGKRPDTKRKAGVIFSGPSFTYRCFRCNSKAHWRPGLYISSAVRELLEVAFVEASVIHKLTVDAIILRDVVDLTVFNRSSNFKMLTFKRDILPVGSVNVFRMLELNPTPQLIQIADYILSRGMIAANATNYYYCDSEKNDLNKRVIIPFYYNNDIVGYTARHINPPNDKTIKYLTKAQPGYLFNNHHLENFEAEYVLLVEGPFCALSINACGYLGDTPNKRQVGWINSMEKKVVLVADKELSGLPGVKTAIKNGWAVSMPTWDDDIKDPNDAVLRYGAVWTMKNILENLHYGETRITSNFKMWIGE